MDMGTTNMTSYQPFKVQPTKKRIQQKHTAPAPMMATSSYKAEFPNWDNGKNDIYHEKSP